MAFDLNNFVIDHVIRGVMTSIADGSYMWSINQIGEPSLNITSETAEKADALGTPIASFNRGKQAEFTANNSLFDLGLFAAQNGVSKEVASAESKIVAPAFETVTTTAGTDVQLKHAPTGQITAIYKLNGDGTLGTKYKAGSEANATDFVHTAKQQTLTIPTGLDVGTQLFIMYDYETENAVAVTGDAINFPKAGKFVMEVLGTDVCDTSTLIHAFVIFPNAKLDANVDISFTTDGNHPFTIKANQSYCDSKKTLFQIVIPEEE